MKIKKLKKMGMCMSNDQYHIIFGGFMIRSEKYNRYFTMNFLIFYLSNLGYAPYYYPTELIRALEKDFKLEYLE